MSHGEGRGLGVAAGRGAGEASTLALGPRLSEKEVAVLREIALGRETDEIAAILIVSPHTVRSHVKNGMRKLRARTRAQAVAIALARGLIEVDAHRP